MRALSAGQVNTKRVAIILVAAVAVFVVVWLLGSRSDPMDPEQRELARIDKLEKNKDIGGLSDVTHSANPKFACRAVGALARVKGRVDGIVYLTETLGDSRDYIRETAAREYGNLGRRQEVAPLVAAMKDTSPGVRCGAAAALGNLRAWDGLDPLVTALDDPEVVVRKSAIAAIERTVGLDLRFRYNADDPQPKRQAAQAEIRALLPHWKRGYEAYMNKLETQGKTP